jgi:hypothetical protein
VEPVEPVEPVDPVDPLVPLEVDAEDLVPLAVPKWTPSPIAAEIAAITKKATRYVLVLC